MKTEINYKTEIANEILRIINEVQNKEAASKFWEVLNKIKAKSCIVKSGMCSGDNIDFLLAFEKGGKNKPFDLFIENIEDVAMRFGFIFGLKPEIFHFNTKYYVEDETYSFVPFKLLKNA